MTKKDNKKSNQVVRDMKECFRSFHLPVYKKRRVKDIELAFTSQICNDHVCAGVAVTYDRQAGYVGIDISPRQKVPSEKMAEIWKLFNLLNGMMPVYHYSVCTCCNGVSLRAGLFLSGDRLSIGKFKRLIHVLLEDSYLCFPLIIEVSEGGNPEALFDQFMEDHRDVMKKEISIPKDTDSKILGDMESVITGLKISIKDDDRLVNGFVIDCMFQDMDFPLRMGMTLDHESETVIMKLAPPFTVPDERIPVMTELINRINKISRPDHLFIHRQTKRVTLLKGIMIDNGVLDKEEFDKAIRTMLGSGCLFFPIVKEQLSSNESPETLLAKIVGIDKGHE